jgi:hypothetical protein
MKNPSYVHAIKEVKHAIQCMKYKFMSLHMRAKCISLCMADLCMQKAIHECSRGLLMLRVEQWRHAAIQSSSNKGSKAPSASFWHMGSLEPFI